MSETTQAATLAGHGVNTGVGYYKHVIIDRNGAMLDPVVFPSAIAPAQRVIEGATASIPTVRIGDRAWWVGESAVATGRPTTHSAQARLGDRDFIPAMVREGARRLGMINGSRIGPAVAGLPATWCGLGATFADGERQISREAALGARLREGWQHWERILVVPEPLALLFSLALDNNGRENGDFPLSGRVGIVDLGYRTLDIAIIQNGVPLRDSLDTWDLGMSVPLRQIRAHLAGHFERDITTHQADAAIRAGSIRIAGSDRPLPEGYDQPLLDHAKLITRRLEDAWGKASDLDAIALGGGGFAAEPVAAATCAAYRQARVAEQPQIAIALGMARRARRLAVLNK